MVKTLSVLDVFKILPGRNCRDCGYMTCLAFATAVIKEGIPIENCPHLSGETAGITPTLKRQQKAGIGRRRLKIEAAVEALLEKLAPLDFAPIAPGLGAKYGMEGKRPYLEIAYFGLQYRIFKDGVRYPPGADDNPWDTVLLYNLVYSRGNSDPSGRWLAMQDLQNSVSKAADIRELQQKLASWADAHFDTLLQNAERLGGTPASPETGADLSMLLHPLVKVPVRITFYKSDPAEGFPADAQFLFDSRIVSYLDMEATVYLVERLVEKLTARAMP
jgi:hypothetical protein